MAAGAKPGPRQSSPCHGADENPCLRRRSANDASSPSCPQSPAFEVAPPHLHARRDVHRAVLYPPGLGGTGRGRRSGRAAQVAKAAGAMLLAGPNLLVVALTSGLGSSWHAAIQQQQSEAGGMMGGFGGTGTPLGGEGMNHSVAVSSWSETGSAAVAHRPDRPAGSPGPCGLPGRGPHPGAHGAPGSGRIAGPPCGARTACGCHGRHGDDGLLPDGTGIRSDRNEHDRQRDGRHDGRVHSAVRLSGLTGFVLAAVCAYGGSRLHALRSSRRAPVGPPTLKAGRVRRAATR